MDERDDDDDDDDDVVVYFKHASDAGCGGVGVVAWAGVAAVSVSG